MLDTSGQRSATSVVGNRDIRVTARPCRSLSDFSATVNGRKVQGGCSGDLGRGRGSFAQLMQIARGDLVSSNEEALSLDRRLFSDWQEGGNLQAALLESGGVPTKAYPRSPRITKLPMLDLRDALCRGLIATVSILLFLCYFFFFFFNTKSSNESCFNHQVLCSQRSEREGIARCKKSEHSECRVAHVLNLNSVTRNEEHDNAEYEVRSV